MDREFMRTYYRNFYLHACDVAIAESEEFRKKQKVRYALEEDLCKMMGGTGTELYRKFDEYITAYEDEKDVMQEEIYLLGACDREKMLR